jgi:hypothetical protein
MKARQGTALLSATETLVNDEEMVRVLRVRTNVRAGRKVKRKTKTKAKRRTKAKS